MDENKSQDNDQEQADNQPETDVNTDNEQVQETEQSEQSQDTQQTEQAEEPTVVQPEQPEQAQQPKKKWFKSKVLIIVVGVLFLLGAGASAYYFTEINKPENKIKLAFSELISADAASVTTTFDVEGSQGSLDLAVRSNPQALSASVTFEFEDQEITVNARMLDNVLYVQLDEIPASFAAFLPPGSELSETLKNTWIKADLDQVSQLAGEDAVDIPDTTLSESDREKLKEILRDTEVLTIVEEVDSKDIDGVSVDGYVVEINEEGAIKALEEIEAANLDVLKDNQEEFSAELESMKESIRGESDELKDEAKVILWLNGSSLKQIEILGEGEDAGQSVTLTINSLGSENVPAIEAPENTTDYMNLLMQLYAQPSAGSELEFDFQ